MFFNKTTDTIRKILKHQTEGIEVFPGEGRIPCNWLKEENFDCKSYPMFFPSGEFGLNEKRKVKLSPQRYFNQRILNFDRRFAKSDSFIFAAQQRVERESLESQFNISFLKGNFQDINGKLSLHSNDYFEMFNHVRGSPKYWHSMKREMMARINQLGPFHVFFTLSCAELRWPEIISSILHLNGNVVEINSNQKDTIVKVNGMLLNEYIQSSNLNLHELMRDNIVTVIRIFDNRLRTFIHEILLSNWTIVNVAYFTYRIEFQLRGLPHAHGVFWFDPEDMKPYYIENTQEFNNNNLVQLIDSFITCEIPHKNDKLHQTVLDVQKHNHTKKCLIANSQVCKYKFPRFPSKRTIIAKPFDFDDEIEEINELMKKRSIVLNNIQLVLTNNFLLQTCHSIDDILLLVGTTIEEYEEFLSISDVGINVILKRSIHELYINNYNATFLEAWNANLDIQMCTDSYAVITYITDYFTKTENHLTTKLHEVYKETKNLGERQSKFLLKNTYLAQREISICEAIYRLFPNLLMKNSNISTVFLNSNIPSKRACFLKNVKNFSNGPKIEQTVQMHGHTGDFVKLKSIHEKYAMRPETLNITLAQFTILFEKCNELPQKTKMIQGCSEQKCNILNIFDESEIPRYIELNDKTLMKARSRHIVLRFHKYDELKDEFSFAYSNLLMFLPWISEQNDLHYDDIKKCIEKYEQYKHLIENAKKKLFPFTTLVKIGESNERNEFFGGILLDNEGTKENDENFSTAIEEFNFRHPGAFEKFEEDSGTNKYSVYLLVNKI